MVKEFSNYTESFNIKGLKELKEFVGTRAQLYSLISKEGWNMTYAEMRDKIVEAIRNNDNEELKHLQSLDGRWYEDITEELEPLREFI